MVVWVDCVLLVGWLECEIVVVLKKLCPLCVHVKIKQVSFQFI